MQPASGSMKLITNNSKTILLFSIIDSTNLNIMSIAYVFKFKHHMEYIMKFSSLAIVTHWK